MIDIDRLKALHEAATAEGWVPVSGYTDFGAHYNGIDGTAGNWQPVVGERDMSEPDIELTCFLRNAVPQIIDMADRLTRYEPALREVTKVNPGDGFLIQLSRLRRIAEEALGDTQ